MQVLWPGDIALLDQFKEFEEKCNLTIPPMMRGTRLDEGKMLLEEYQKPIIREAFKNITKSEAIKRAAYAIHESIIDKGVITTIIGCRQPEVEKTIYQKIREKRLKSSTD